MMKQGLPLALFALLATAVPLHAKDPAKENKPAETAPSKATPSKPGRFKWYTSVKQARKAAAESGKPVLMLFTGSDWCPYCIKLEKEILSSKEFKTWATENVILFIADSKGGPGKLTPPDAKLMKEYGATGFPTIFLTDAEGKKLGRAGYTGDKPAEYCSYLSSLITPKK